MRISTYRVLRRVFVSKTGCGTDIRKEKVVYCKGFIISTPCHTLLGTINSRRLRYRSHVVRMGRE